MKVKASESLIGTVFLDIEFLTMRVVCKYCKNFNTITSW